MIFNGIEIMFYMLGILSAVGALILIKYAKRYVLKWSSWLLGILTIIFTLFTIAWSWSSILEKEPQAAGMGLLTFGIPSLILLFVTRQVVLKSDEKIQG